MTDTLHATLPVTAPVPQRARDLTAIFGVRLTMPAPQRPMSHETLDVIAKGYVEFCCFVHENSAENYARVITNCTELPSMIPYYATQISNKLFEEIHKQRVLTNVMCAVESDMKPRRGENCMAAEALAEYFGRRAEDKTSKMLSAIRAQALFSAFCKKFGIRLEEMPAGRSAYQMR